MANLQIVITGKDMASDVFEDLQDQLGSLEDTAGEVGQAIAVGLVGAIGALTAAVGISVKTAADFEQSLANTAAATGATSEQMAKMREEALGIGKDTSKSASEAAAAMAELVKAGMSTETVVSGAARAVIQLAEATGSDVAAMAILVSNSLNTFKKDGLEAADVANLVARTANASAIGTADLAASLAMVGPVAAQAGLSANDFAIAIGLLGNNALKGSDAGTSLKTMLLSLTAPSDGAAKLLDQLGVSMFNAEGKTRPFRDVLGSLQEALKGSTEEQQAMTLKTIFGTDAIRAANILLGEGVKGWDAFNESLGKAPTVAEQSATRLNTLNGTIEQIKGTLEVLAIKVGDILLPVLTGIGKAANKALGGDFAGAFEILKETFNTEVPKIVERLSGMAKSFTDWIQNEVMPRLGPELEKVWAGITGWIDSNSKDLPTKMLDFSAGFLSWLSTDVIPKIGTELGKFLDTVLAWVRKEENTTAIRTALDHWVASFLGFIEFQVVPRLGPEVLKLVVALGKLFFEMNAKVTEIGLRMADAILSGIAQGLLRNAEAVVGTAMRNALKLAFPALAGMIDSVFSAKSGSSGGVDQSGTGVLKGPDGKTVNVPKLAAGGIVTRPTLAMFGEAGPEAVVPLDRLGGMGTTVVFNGPVYGLGDFRDRVVEALTFAERQGRLRPGTMSA